MVKKSQQPSTRSSGLSVRTAKTRRTITNTAKKRGTIKPLNYNIKNTVEDPNVIQRTNDVKQAVFTYGRMNPPTEGHAILIDAMIEKYPDADKYILVTHTHEKNKIKNPLKPQEKIRILKQKYPSIKGILATTYRKPYSLSMKGKLEDAGYTKVKMIVGTNKKATFGWNKSEINKVNRNTTVGISATALRKAAKTNNHTKFKELFILKNDTWVKNTMNKVRKILV